MLANLELQEIVLYSMIKKIDHTSGLGADMYFSVPLAEDYNVFGFRCR